MKRFLLVLVLLAVLAGCVTNPYNQDNVARGETVPQPWTAYALGWVPGLHQFLNGEIGEGLLYAGVFLGSAVTGAMLFATNRPTESDPDYPLFLILATGTIGSFGWSWADAVTTTEARFAEFSTLTGAQAVQLFAPPFDPSHIRIGMTYNQAIEFFGQPDKQNVADYGSGPEVQAIWYAGKATFYLYFKAGRLRSYQRF